MYFPEYILMAMNLVLGCGCAIPLAGMLRKLNEWPVGLLRLFAILFGIYFIECIAVAMGMGIPVFSMGLAFVWGIVFGLRLWGRASTRRVLKTSFFLSLYTSLPAASFIALPFLMWANGWDVLSAQEGTRFGIPEFQRFFPTLNTILGFYTAVVTGAVVFKTVITTGGVSLLIYLGEKSTADGSKAV